MLLLLSQIANKTN